MIHTDYKGSNQIAEKTLLIFYSLQLSWFNIGT